MRKEELSKLPIDEQCFILYNHIENNDYETIRWIEQNYDYCVYNGWL